MLLVHSTIKPFTDLILIRLFIRGGDDHHGLGNEYNHDDGLDAADDDDDDGDDDTSPSRQHFGSWAPSTVETMRSIFANSPPNSPNSNPTNPTLIFSFSNSKVYNSKLPVSRYDLSHFTITQ